MSLSDCLKCWSTPCQCGWDYRDWSKDARIKLAANVLGVNVSEVERLSVPDVHPKFLSTTGASEVCVLGHHNLCPAAKSCSCTCHKDDVEGLTPR